MDGIQAAALSVKLKYIDEWNQARNNAEDFPVAHKYQGEIISLPKFPELKNDQIEYVTDSIKKLYRWLT